VVERDSKSGRDASEKRDERPLRKEGGRQRFEGGYPRGWSAQQVVSLAEKALYPTFQEKEKRETRGGSG